MLGILLAWRAVEGATRPLRPSNWEPAKNDVDLVGGLLIFALVLLVLIIGTAVLALWGIWGIVVVTSRMVIRTTEPEGGE